MGLVVTLAFYLTPVLVPVMAVIGIHKLATRRIGGKAGIWAELGMFSALAAGLMYCWGLWNMFAWDIEETCRLKHAQPWDPAKAGSSLFPPKNQCNQFFDLVPGYVTPVIVACLAVAVFFAALAIRTAVRNRRAKPPEAAYS